MVVFSLRVQVKPCWRVQWQLKPTTQRSSMFPPQIWFPSGLERAKSIESVKPYPSAILCSLMLSGSCRFFIGWCEACFKWRAIESRASSSSTNSTRSFRHEAKTSLSLRAESRPSFSCRWTVIRNTEPHSRQGSVQYCNALSFCSLGVQSTANEGILVLGATNIPWGLDGAIRRRFAEN